MSAAPASEGRAQDASQTQAAARLFAALAHPGRLEVMRRLVESGPQCAGALAKAARLSQTAMSHQLRVLREAELVEVNREGRHLLYTLADHHVAHIIKDALEHAQE